MNWCVNTMAMRLRRYSVWSDGEGGITMVVGDDIPRFADGTPQGSKNSLLFTIDAATLDEAMAIRNLRLGRAPYRPGGKAADCPNCAATYYPESFGGCWK